jgi:hypothetical protein
MVGLPTPKRSPEMILKLEAAMAWGIKISS